jgi:hypothetical protein
MAATSAQTGHVALSFADRAQLLARSPAPTCEVDIVDVEYDYASGAQNAATAVVVKGLAWGPTKVDVTLTASLFALPLTLQANVGVTNAWTRAFALPAPGLPLGTTLQISVAAAGGGACNAVASLSATLEVAPDPVVADPAACLAGFEHERNHFVAGHADRLIRTRSFVPLVCSNFEMTTHQRKAMVRHMTRTGLSRHSAYEMVVGFADALRTAGHKAMRALQGTGGKAPSQSPDEVKQGVITQAKRVLTKLLASAVAGRPRSKKAVRAVDESHGVFPGEVELSAAAPALAPERTLRLQAAAAQKGANSKVQATLATGYGTHVSVVDGVDKYALSSWLGILFYDRLRFRPAGLVAGEQVYSLALAPGEEVTLTQRSETKRSRSFEEILDQTTERELEFSSTWSTDFTQSDTNSQTNSVGGNLGVSVGIPIEGVEIGVNAGVNAQSSNTISSEVQRTRAQETTSRFSAKSREQHKTTFKVSTDITEEFGSKRVLRNANPSRALTLNFYKLHQKHRVLLERNDAKLTLALCIEDPGRELRDELEEEFAKLDPKVPPGTCAEIPTGGSTSSSRVVENRNADDWGGDEYGVDMFSTVLPPNTVLSNWKFEITDWLVDDGSGHTYYADVSAFTTSGGEWWFQDTANIPTIGQSGALSHVVVILMPEAFGAGWWTVNVTGRMTWSYVPNDAITAEVQSCLADAAKKIRDSFSAERVLAKLQEVAAGRRDLVLQRLFETVLLRDYYKAKVNPPCDVLERVRNFFEWNEAVIEYLPWWMTPGGRDRREQLRQRLLAMPGDTPSNLVIDDILIASAAHVYLPIRAGAESDALAFLLGRTTIAGSNLAMCVKDFVDWRDQNLGAVSWPLPTYDQVLAPAPGPGTATGRTDWQNDWERARRKFLVLDEWNELLPTDGVHVEPVLSTCSATDEFRASALRSDLLASAGRQAVDAARAELEESLANKPAPATTIVIGEPGRTVT